MAQLTRNEARTEFHGHHARENRTVELSYPRPQIELLQISTRIKITIIGIQAIVRILLGDRSHHEHLQ